MDHLVAETAAAHALEVHAAGFGRAAEHGDEGRDVLADSRAHAGKRVGTDMAVLMHQGIAGQDRPVAYVHVAGQGRVVDQDAVVANDAVVADVA